MGGPDSPRRRAGSVLLRKAGYADWARQSGTRSAAMRTGGVPPFFTFDDHAPPIGKLLPRTAKRRERGQCIAEQLFTENEGACMPRQKDLVLQVIGSPVGDLRELRWSVGRPSGGSPVSKLMPATVVLRRTPGRILIGPRVWNNNSYLGSSVSVTRVTRPSSIVTNRPAAL